jgi:hypothetical protein
LWKVDELEAGTLAASDAASFERHLRACTECRDRLRIDRRLRDLVGQLSPVEPDDLRIHRLRARILSDARAHATHPRSRWMRAWLVGAVTLVTALLTVAFLVSHRRSLPLQDDPFAGSVTAAPGIQWSQSREAKVETLRLTQGELWIVVRKQTPEERFLVKMPDGEIEVRGTTFNVRVDEHVTRHVHVVEGRVALRLRGHLALELVAGQAWDLDTPAPSATPSLVAPVSTFVPTSVAAAPLPDARNPPPPAWRPNMESEDYKAAMDLYRGAHYAEAAEAFRRFASEHRSSGLMEDATFLEALSLTRSGRVDAGSVVATRHLAEFPNSFHRKEASLLVARAARDRGECREARQSLAPWLSSDADATIPEALGACAEP